MVKTARPRQGQGHRPYRGGRQDREARVRHGDLGRGDRRQHRGARARSARGQDRPTHVVTDAYCRTGVEGSMRSAIWPGALACAQGVPRGRDGGRTDRRQEHRAPGVARERSPAAPIATRRSRASGLTEAKAKEKRATRSRSATSPSSATARRSPWARPEGHDQDHLRRQGTGELLGAHMVGAEVTELIQGYVVGRQLGDHGRRPDAHGLPAPDAERDDARVGARRLRARDPLLRSRRFSRCDAGDADYWVR